MLTVLHRVLKMRLKRLILFPLMMMVLMNGSCFHGPSRNEGRATAILDQAVIKAEAHAKSLAARDIKAARLTGAELIAVLRVWVD